MLTRDLRAVIRSFQFALATLLTCVALAQPPSSTGIRATGVKPLSILLVGANGMIGSRILAEATSRGHHVIAASRHPEKIASGPNVQVVKLDATDRDAFTALARKADVIVMATSPRGGGDPAKEAKAVDDSAIAVAQATGKRLVVVGGAGSLKLPDGRSVADTLPVSYRGEALAMRGVLDSLEASPVDWTFFSPAMSIRPGTRTGKYQLGTTTVLSDQKGESRISAEDYADALVNELERPAHRRAQMTIAY